MLGSVRWMTTHDDLILKGEGRPAAPLSRAHAAAVLRLGVSVEQDGATGARAAGLEDRERGSIAPNVPFAGDTRRAAAAGGITVAMLVAAGIGIPDSGQIAPIGGATGGSVRGLPGSTAVRSAIDAGDDRRQEQDPMKSPGVRAAVMAGVVMVASSAGAQQMPAVQWRVDDGGNGHWYQVASTPLPWTAARDYAETRGSHLVTVTSASEQGFLWSLASPVSPIDDIWIGANQAPGSCEPGCGWRWVTDEPFGYVNWDSTEPNNNTLYGDEDAVCVNERNAWNDLASSSARRCVIEWDADCNNDGIVDFGQCRDGTLPDYDGNNIPDCCENGESCVVGTYPVQWRVGEGGNGHWYRVVIGQVDVTWVESRGAAEGQGGHLATLNSLAENAWVHAMVIAHPAAFMNHGPWLGGSYGDQGWQWVTGEPWRFTAWTPENPSGDGTGMGYWEITNPASASWNDAPESNHMVSSVVEWSADCNSDGIVDYGQILAGDFTDANSNGIPDVCEVPSCIDADLNPNGIVNGADLGALLAFWGPVSPAFPRADINGDGNVNGADLGILLSLWGPCGG